MAHPDVRIRLDLKIPMRDGVRLYGALYLPATGEKFPTLLVRTIYSTQRQYDVDLALLFAASGYAVLLQDCRGRFDSDGDFRPYVDEMQDGYDTQQWIGSQPWCDGTLGTFGRSYGGFTQILPASLHSPYLKALVPIANQEDNYGHIRYNGTLQVQNAMNFIWVGDRTTQVTPASLIDFTDVHRRLPLISALDDIADRPFYREVNRHPNFDDFWKSHSMKGRYAQVEAPAYVVTGWYDNLMHECFKCYHGWKHQAGTPQARARSKLLVGPWPHSPMGTAAPFGDIEFGAGGNLDLGALHLRWFDRRLKGIDNGIDDEPPVRLFIMGRNTWRDEAEWPLARTQYTRFYLHSQGQANSLTGDGALSLSLPAAGAPDTFAYDPADPVPTLGGQSMLEQTTGPRDRRPVERREDVLVYTSPPLERDLEVTGPVTLTLYAASSAPDTDFTATLVDVYPGGMAIHICEGIVRARFRESYEAPTLIEPGRIYAYHIDLWETSNLFKAGHCIRLEVSSSNFPRFDRNLNTGHVPGLDAEMQVAQQTIYHDDRYPSHLTLPLIPA